MKNRILWLRPVTTSELNPDVQRFLDDVRAPDTEIAVRTLDRGPRHLEYYYYSALVLADTLREIKRAEQEDYYDRGTDFNPFTIRT